VSVSEAKDEPDWIHSYQRDSGLRWVTRGVGGRGAPRVPQTQGHDPRDTASQREHVDTLSPTNIPPPQISDAALGLREYEARTLLELQRDVALSMGHPWGPTPNPPGDPPHP